MIERTITSELAISSTEYPIVTILGPRQSGKTTLTQMQFPGRPYYSMEDPDVRLAAELDPRGFLAQLPEGGIIDEVQRLPVLLSYLQGVVDKEQQAGMFILTGSHQPDLHHAISQSLAGRTALLTLLPFSLAELANYGLPDDPFQLIIKGGYPRLHDKQLRHDRFYGSYLQTYVERDVRALVNLKDLSRFQQFLILLAGRVGQLLNYSSLSNDIGVSATTIKNWLSVLKASYIVFELPPFYENLRKRVVKSPKIYFTDTGLLSFLLGIRTAEQAARDPLRGGLYENFIILEILKSFYNRGLRPDLYFFRDSRGNEVDLLIREQGRLKAVEIKSAATFTERFLSGIIKLDDLLGDRYGGGMVLYNGNRELEVRGIRILNPLQTESFRWFEPQDLE